LLLLVSGALLIVVGASLPGQTTSYRVVNVLVGVAFFGYGLYLEFLFTGGKYFVFYYVFAAPVLLVIRTFKARNAAKAAQAAQAQPVTPPPVTEPVTEPGA
jgi:hypothetical protein